MGKFADQDPEQGSVPKVDISQLKPSELLEVALKDLEAVEHDPRYRIEMNTWHSPDSMDGTKVCFVCFAGAVMAHSLGADPRRYCTPVDFEDHQAYRALVMLERFRKGWVALALRECGYATGGLPDNVEVPDHRLGPQGFKQAMRKIVDLLREHDL